MQAENKPFEPEPVSAGVGKRQVFHILRFPFATCE